MAAPFTSDVFDEAAATASQNTATDDLLALPASHRTRRSDHGPGDDIVLPATHMREFLQNELLVPRLNEAAPWLWQCGRPMPPRPLHYQLLLRRAVAVTEDPDLHLVWSKGRIFVKPLPAWLLRRSVWEAHLGGGGGGDEQLGACARGFLFSYCALVAYRSDFRIATETGLLPEQLTWAAWKALSRQVLDGHSYAQVNPRYWYGELRLGRLNGIYRFRLGRLVRGYTAVDAPAVYTDLLQDNLGVLAALLVYVVVVLTAMQVGLAVDDLKANSAFRNASYYFTVISILLPLAGVLVIAVLFLPIFCTNWRATKRYEADRFRHIGVDGIRKQERGSSSSLQA